MKKLLIIALLAGCGSSTPAATTTPDPVVAEESTAALKYAGVTNFLRYLITLDRAQFTATCVETSGHLGTETENFLTCMQGNEGFAAQYDDTGAAKGSSVLVTATEGEELAKALYDELGAPTYTAGNSAQWDFPGFTVVFGPVGNIGYIAIMERAGTAL